MDSSFVIVIMQHRVTGKYEYFTSTSEKGAREYYDGYYSKSYKIAASFRGKDTKI